MSVNRGRRTDDTNQVTVDNKRNYRRDGGTEEVTRSKEQKRQGKNLPQHRAYMSMIKQRKARNNRRD